MNFGYRSHYGMPDVRGTALTCTEMKQGTKAAAKQGRVYEDRRLIEPSLGAEISIGIHENVKS